MTRAITSRRHPLVLACREARGGGDDQPLLLDGWHLLVEAVRSPLDVDAVLVAAPTARRGEREALAALDERGAQVVGPPPTCCTPPARCARPRASSRSPGGPASALDRVFAPAPALVVAVTRCAGSRQRRRAGAHRRGRRRAPAWSPSAPRPIRSGGRRCARRWAVPSACPSRASPTPRRSLPSARAGTRRWWRSSRRDGVPPAGLDLARADVPAPRRRGTRGAGRRCWRGADARLRLPMRPPVESLNVAVAGALALYAAAAQRGRTR